MFTSIIQDKLLIAPTPEELNKEVTQMLERITPILKKREESTLFSILFSKKVNMNEGVHDCISFDEEYLAFHPEMESIVRQAHAQMTSNEFQVDSKNGIICIDVYDIDVDTPIETPYADVICDNILSRFPHHSCTFYAQKDADVKGDLEIYTKDPTVFGNGKKIVLPTTSHMTILRHGDQLYTIQPHHGKGKEMIMSICFEAL
jgi:hypothetical protein